MKIGDRIKFKDEYMIVYMICEDCYYCESSGKVIKFSTGVPLSKYRNYYRFDFSKGPIDIFIGKIGLVAIHGN